MVGLFVFFFFQAEDGIRDLVRSRGLGDVYKRQLVNLLTVVADKVHRDQNRLGDMRRNLITTQKELKLSLIHI